MLLKRGGVIAEHRIARLTAQGIAEPGSTRCLNDLTDHHALRIMPSWIQQGGERADTCTYSSDTIVVLQHGP
jgi:hypothetical protein